MSDKNLFSNLCKKAKIKHPLLISDISKIKKNKLYVIKDRFGVGCSRIQIISGKDLKHFDSKKYIIQEYIKGKSFSASIFCSKGDFTILSLNEHQVKKNKNNSILGPLLGPNFFSLGGPGPQIGGPGAPNLDWFYLHFGDGFQFLFFSIRISRF